MELDEMKQTWAAMELRLGAMEALLQKDSRDRRTGNARAALRPLFWGQLLQLVIGNALVICGAVLWASHLHQPDVLVCGLVAHAYGLLLTIFAARNLYLIRQIDYAAPVLDIQRRIAMLRAFRVRVETPVNAVAGCFIWIPVLWVNLAFHGINLWSLGFVRWAVASGVAGLVSIAVVVWVMRRLGYGSRIDEASAGRSIVRAQAALEEVARFASE
ncbi:MAG: hypothetical protein ACREPU_01655 [Rhodanobacteraceae bacterium]